MHMATFDLGIQVIRLVCLGVLDKSTLYCCLAGKMPFDFPITAFYGSQDRRISKEMVNGWQQFTTADFRLLRIEGNHLWPLAAGPKTAWLQRIVESLQ